LLLKNDSRQKKVMHPDNLSRYSRQIRLPEIGRDGQEKISQAKVLVVGAGALGSAALMYLVAAGVGTVGILDNDVVELHNLHRQVIYSTEDIGKPKVQMAEKRLRAMNPDVKLKTHFLRLGVGNALDIFKAYDLILDCSDNFPTKYLVNDASVMLNKPCIIGAAQGFSGQLSVFNFKDGPTYRCLFPDPPDPLLVPSCADTGVMGMVPGVIGTLQALEAIKIITGAGETLSGRLLHFGGLTGQFMEMDIQPDPRNKEISRLTEYKNSCPDDLLDKHLIDNEEFMSRLNDRENNMVIAFSEDDQPVRLQDYTWQPVPLYKLPEVIGTVPAGKSVLLVCEYGIKSTEALKYLLGNEHFSDAYGLKEGLAGLRHAQRP
jgi:sulfur-carrier protein adenylyltransferase/sulfurtransferase